MPWNEDYLWPLALWLVAGDDDADRAERAHGAGQGHDAGCAHAIIVGDENVTHSVSTPLISGFPMPCIVRERVKQRIQSV